MSQYLITIGVLLLLMLGWVTVQQLARLFAKRHPEFGPHREAGGCGSGGACGCKGGNTCQSNKQ